MPEIRVTQIEQEEALEYTSSAEIRVTQIEQEQTLEYVQNANLRVTQICRETVVERTSVTHIRNTQTVKETVLELSQYGQGAARCVGFAQAGIQVSAVGAVQTVGFGGRSFFPTLLYYARCVGFSVPTIFQKASVGVVRAIGFAGPNIGVVMDGVARCVGFANPTLHAVVTAFGQVRAVGHSFTNQIYATAVGYVMATGACTLAIPASPSVLCFGVTVTVSPGTGNSVGGGNYVR